jgi:hypothetical protein
MTLSIRRSGTNDVFYNPERDLAYIHTWIVRTALDNLEPSRWQEWFAGIFRSANLTEEQLGQAAQAYGKYLQSILDQDVKVPLQAFEKAGWNEVAPAARAALLMKIGQVVTVFFFTALRQVTPMGGQPPTDIEMAMKAVERALNLYSMPRWKRKLWLAWYRFRRFFSAEPRKIFVGPASTGPGPGMGVRPGGPATAVPGPSAPGAGSGGGPDNGPLP